MDRYEGLAHAFVGLADTLVADYDVVELAQQLIDSSMALLPVAAAGILLGDARGNLHVLASSSEQTRLLELFQVQTNLGPCLQAYRSKSVVLVNDLSAMRHLWPAFAERALDNGFRAVCALPMRLRDECIGALNLFRAKAEALSEANVAVGQALADVATIGILHQRVAMRSELVQQQLQSALNTRVIIEQAKGVLAERGALDVSQSFKLLRTHARRTNQRLVDLARAVVDGAPTDDVLNLNPPID